MHARAVETASDLGKAMRPFLLFAAAILISGRVETRPAPDEAPLALFWRPAKLFGLARLDPTSLQPREPVVEIGEYHYTWSFSPDRSQLAVGISAPGVAGRIGIRVVDVRQMRVVRDVETGIAAEALAWLTPTRLVAVTQAGDALLVDPPSGQVLRRSSLLVPSPCDPFNDLSKQEIGVTRGGLVVLRRVGEMPQLAVLDAEGASRTAALPGLRLGSRPDGSCERAAVAVDPDRERAFIFGAGPEVSEVDLRSMAVRQHDVTGLQSESSGSQSVRRALWLGGERVVFGQELVKAKGARLERTPAGVALVDTGRWTAHLLERRASKARLVGSTLLVYGGSVGLHGYGLRGEPAFNLLGNARVHQVEAWGQLAYALTADSVCIVDPMSGVLVRKVADVSPGPGRFFLLWPEPRTPDKTLQ